MRSSTDFLVLGSGIAGLTFALRAARHGEVMIVTKRAHDDAATSWAQGGVAAVLGNDDSFERHVSDTIGAGAGLCHEVVVELCVHEGPGDVRWLTELGVEFSRDQNGELDLAREGGHTARRVAHAGDITGHEIERALLDAVRQHPNIRMLDWHMGVDLITRASSAGRISASVRTCSTKSRAGSRRSLARATVLATGGAGKVYLYTSNPDVATGDGVAMAYRAGAEIANMEFYQFHPTCLYHPRAKNFLDQRGAARRRRAAQAA